MEKDIESKGKKWKEKSWHGRFGGEMERDRMTVRRGKYGIETGWEEEMWVERDVWRRGEGKKLERDGME